VTINRIDATAAVAHVKKLLAQETSLSPALVAAVEVLLMLVAEVDPKNWTVGFVKTEGA